MKIEKITKIKGVERFYDEVEEKGLAKISKYVFNSKEAGCTLFNLRALRDDPMFRMYDGKYVRLFVDGKLMMSDTAMERMSNHDIIEKAKGKVLIAGLGLGLILPPILEKEEAIEVVIIEKYQDVIDLVGPKFDNPKLKIICADIFEYTPKKKFDTIYFDIWPEICSDNLNEIETLEEKYQPFLKKNGYMNSWFKERLIIKKGIEDGEICEDCFKHIDECECEACEYCCEKLNEFGDCDYCDDWD